MKLKIQYRSLSQAVHAVESTIAVLGVVHFMAYDRSVVNTLVDIGKLTLH